MSFSISDFASGLVDRYVILRRNGMCRRWDRKTCRAHPEWTPLTAEELANLPRKDRWGYMFFKNMSGEMCAPGDLRYFIPGGPFATELLPRLNPMNHRSDSRGFDTEFTDKNYAGLFMSDMTFPQAVVRRIAGQFYDRERRPITREEALALLRPYDELVFKQTVDTAHGEGIRLVAATDFERMLTDHGDNYVVQVRLRQHEILAYFNPSSVNILRVTTLCWRGEVYVLGGILRAGAPGAFCDHENKDGQTYLSIPLAEDGTILPRACDVDYGHVYGDCHGIPIRGKIPRYEEIKALVRKEHIRYPHYGLIGWDITLDEDENIICMEFNTKYPGLTGTQGALGPVLAQKSVRGVPLLDEILGGK